jgi:AraC-like DNA-binding protein
MLLYLSLFTILLSFVLLVYTKKSNSNAFYLALFFILSSTFGLAHHFVFQTADVFWIAVFFNHFVPFMFLIGPFLYFYVRATLNETKKLSAKDSLHFIPALISLLGTIPYYCTPFATKISIAQQLIDHVNSLRSINVNLFYDAGESFVLRSALCFGYVVFSGYCVRSYYKKNSNPTQLQSLILLWLSILVGATLFISTLFLLISYAATFIKIREAIVSGHPFYLATGIVYFILTLSLLQFPSVLYGIPKTETKKTKKKKVKESKKILKETQIEVLPKLADEGKLVEMCSNIDQFLMNKKPYLDPQFSVFSIAIALGVSEIQVNHAIKNGMNTTFVKLRSELRVAHAINLLQSAAKEQLTIEAIGEQSGFKTRSNFYTVFKEITGLTPSEYLNQK